MSTQPKRPILVDARAMERQHPDTFERPPDDVLSNLRAGDVVKVAAVPGERFWDEITGIDRDVLTGTVSNRLVATPGLKFGDVIEFTFSNVYAIG